MEERNVMFRHDYMPILYQSGPLDVSPHDSFSSGKHFGSLTTHNLLQPGPNEIRTLRSQTSEKMTDRMPWMARQVHLQGRVDHHLWRALRDRDTASNHGHMLIPDYVLPGYTGCVQRNPTISGSLFKRCCPLANYDYDVIQKKMTYQCQHVSEPCRQITPIVPGLRLCAVRREWV